LNGAIKEISRFDLKKKRFK